MTSVGNSIISSFAEICNCTRLNVFNVFNHRLKLCKRQLGNNHYIKNTNFKFNIQALFRTQVYCTLRPNIGSDQLFSHML